MRRDDAPPFPLRAVMWGSVVVYTGFILAVFGLAAALKPPRWFIRTRRAAAALAAAGILLAVLGALLPAPESRVNLATMRLDEFAPAWQFHEVHTIRIAAAPAQVFEAIRQVRADEIFLFRTLTWIRRAGQPLPAGILHAGDREPLIDVAVGGGFVRLVDQPPQELVIGAIVVAPPGARPALTAETFRASRPPGFALAAMNFLVTPDGRGGSWVSTETRVFANSASARRRFAAYWRVIYPGSALIRRMWLRAIERRATAGT